VGDTDAAFTAYATARAPALRRTAYLLCGDWHLAEDLVQTTLTKLYLAWGRVERRNEIDAYVRRVLARSWIDETRRSSHREVVTATAPEVEVAGPDLDDRVVLLRALDEVPPGQRLVLVLRFWDDLSIAETAAALGCSEGNVKSQAARGLEALRRQLARAGVVVAATEES
jgi:RNA polymerase sigma-70 factor (sigma-E family)